MTYKVTLKGNQNFGATERKREKFARNASAEIWEVERKVEEMLLNWGKEKRRNEAFFFFFLSFFSNFHFF